MFVVTFVALHPVHNLKRDVLLVQIRLARASKVYLNRATKRKKKSKSLGNHASNDFKYKNEREEERSQIQRERKTERLNNVSLSRIQRNVGCLAFRKKIRQRNYVKMCLLSLYSVKLLFLFLLSILVILTSCTEVFFSLKKKKITRMYMRV